MKKPMRFCLVLTAVLLLAACTARAVPTETQALPSTSALPESTAAPTQSGLTPSSPTQTSTQASTAQPSGKVVEVVAEDLDIPWEVAFLPDGSLLLTERTGNLVLLSGGQVKARIPVEGVNAIGEGGLLGLALDPKFAENNFIYLYLTSSEQRQIVNRVERFTLQDQTLAGRTVILEGIAGFGVHDGGRIEFGPDGYLYITTGDAGNGDNAQNLSSLNGKILRIKSDGSIPADNPFGTAVWSYGHRNPEGLTWDDQGRLWETEHGPSGADTGYDEINLIEPGKNYGWPVIQGDQTHEGMVTPVLQSGGNETWAPGDVQFYKGYLYFSGLRGSTLYRVQIVGDSVQGLTRYLVGEFGRLRAARLGPDGLLYLTTSNRDGRGQPNQGDDKLLKVNLDLLG